MPDGVMDLDPNRVGMLLHSEAQGQLPEAWKPVIEKLRSSGTLPPPLPGGSQLWGSKLNSGQPTSAYKPQIPPAPTISRLGSAAAEIPGAVDAAKSSMKSVGKTVLDTALDPEVLGSTAGGLLGGVVGGPVGGVLGAGAGGALVAGAREHVAANKENRPESIGPAASSFVSGAAGEGLGRVIPKVFSSEMTPIGAKTAAALGDKAMIPDLVQSSGWDLARNVAREGLGSRGKMLGREEENAGTMLGKVKIAAEKELPSGGSLSPNTSLADRASLAGREAQNQLRENFVSKTAEGKDLFKDFMGRKGNTIITKGATDPMTGVQSKGVTLRSLHERRSAALEAARDAAASNDYVGQMKAMKTVHAISDKIETAAPNEAAEYNKISGQYGQIMEQYDNPIVRQLREKVPAENLVDVMLHPDKLKTFAPFRENSTTPGRTIPTHQAVSQEDAVHMVRQALGEDKFHQLRADTIMQLGEEAKTAGPSGIDGLQGREVTQQLNKLPRTVQTALFGPGTSQALNEIAQVTEHTQRTRSGTGALWIVMRQPAEMLKVAGIMGGLATGAAAAGHQTGHDNLGLTTAGTILLSPIILSSILRSPTATKLFVRAIGAQPTMKAKIIQRLAAQIPMEAAREQTPYAEGGSMPSVPEPPER